ncbi:AbrB/MazE/SpoVT family DNA-binding domain-containing protein [Haloglomus litoreum]|uniref:AbrB/MazE/SpoVT family DNA-binding domain-containing protein n=1 Tax=Haloglomus litoreum TaxID=3034026 RepID=UPI0023E87BF4|nr:AbrB/MazE/SpoVT family DNA-binding domain-containing protein [Haloglomus sp. DT116]
MSQAAPLVLLGSRRIQQTGNSHAVTIPTEALEAMGVEKGDEVLLTYDRENEQLQIEHDTDAFFGTSQ